MKPVPISILLALCASAAADAAPQPNRNVLVWVDAPLFLDADAAAPSVHLGQLDHARDTDIGHVVPMHVVVDGGGDFVEVEPTATTDCAWWGVLVPRELASLHVFVRRSDLSPVVTRAFARTYADGSRISVAAGAPYSAGQLSFSGTPLHAAIPDENVGTDYAPHPVSALPGEGKHSWYLDEHAQVTLGGQTSPFGPWTANVAARRGERMLVTIAARCMTAVVSVPAADVQADIAIGKIGVLGHGGPGLSARNADRYYLPVGTKLTSETGDHVVGQLRVDVDVQPPTGGRACTTVELAPYEPGHTGPFMNLASRADRTLRLCAPADAVKVERRSRY